MNSTFNIDELTYDVEKDLDKYNHANVDTNNLNSLNNENINYIQDEIRNAQKWLKEANKLISADTIDSLLRYFQTGIIGDVHLPSLIVKDNKEIQRKLAKKLEDIILEIGFQWNDVELKRNGRLMLEYIKDRYTLEFATFDPFKRAIVFHFDFDEMERERDILLHKVKHNIAETMERFKDTKAYLNNNTGMRRIKNKKTIERLEQNIKNIGTEITDLEEKIQEINEQKELLEIIKSKTPELDFHFRKYGVSIQFAKGENYEV